MPFIIPNKKVEAFDVMGGGFVILIWLVAACIYCAITALFCALFLLGWFKKWIWLRWVAGVPAVGLILLAATLVIGITYGIIRSHNPKNVFESTFGQYPSSSVSDIKSSLYWFADTGSVYLRFKTTESEFRSLVPKDLISYTSEGVQRDAPIEFGSEPPAWWTYETNPNWIYFFRSDRPSVSDGPSKRGFYTETEYFAFDPASQTAYYRFLGID